MQPILRLCMICSLLLLNNSSHSLAISSFNNNYVSIAPVQKSLKSAKPLRVRVILYKLAQKLLAYKKSKSGVAIAFGILSVLLLSFLLFALAYGGTSGGIVILLGAVGLALIVFGLIKISKAQKRKRKSS